MAGLWNDEKQIEYDMKQIRGINERTGAFLRMVSQFDDRRLPNIGIYLNNKMVEVYRYLKEHKMPYFMSEFRSAIYDYLMSFVEQAYMAMNQYVNNINKQVLVGIFDNIKKDEDSLQKYEDMCNRILNFDIERDIEQAIRSHLDTYINRDFYSGDVNVVIDRTNKELKSLGFDISFEHMDAPAKWIPGEIAPELLDEMKEELEQVNSETNKISGKHSKKK